MIFPPDIWHHRTCDLTDDIPMTDMVATPDPFPFRHGSGGGEERAKSMTMTIPASAQNVPAPNTDE